MGLVRFLDELHTARGPLDDFEAPRADRVVDLQEAGAGITSHAVEIDFVPTEEVIDVTHQSGSEQNLDLVE